MSRIYYTNYDFHPLGKLILASYEDELVYIDINENGLANFADRIGLDIKNEKASVQKAITQLKEYFAGERKVFDLKLRFLAGTEFQQKVWKELQNIPYGKTVSYKELAQRIYNPNACRAVGNANSKNLIPIVVPCHRVIHANGGLGGFSCSLGVKKLLLEMEGIDKV